MSQGKFSNPRPHREEEREIEKAYWELTRKKTRNAQETELESMHPKAAALSADRDNLPEELPSASETDTPSAAPELQDRQIEETFRQVTGQPVHRAAQAKPVSDLCPEDPDIFRQADDAPAASARYPQWMTEVLEFYKQNTKLVLAALCALALMLIVFVITLFVRSASDPYGGKILNNVYIGDVNVGGMRTEEAVAALNKIYGSVYSTEDMVIDLSGTQLKLTPRDSGAAFDTAAAVEEAYAYGRTGTQAERDAAYKASKKEPHNIPVLPFLNLKTENIRKFLREKASNPGNTLVQTSYGLQGTEPELSAEEFDKDAPCQTLVITMGTPGIGFDADAVYSQILDAYSLCSFLVTVEDVHILREPDPIDLDKIYREFYIEPVNASVDTVTGKRVSGSYGYGFDMEAAQKLLDEAQYGAEIRISMEYIAPDILNASAFFADTLGEYQTRATSNDNRTANLRLACQAIDGTVLNPGESLSFQNIVGQLSSGRGYHSAPPDNGLDSTMGGGVAQVSSTLYCAALLADVSVIARTNLEQMPSYIPSGLDADISLKLKNNLTYPIRIDAMVSGGYVRISIMGTEERDYYRMLGSDVVQTYKPEKEYVDFPYDNSEGYLDGDIIQEGRDGYQVKSYTVKYDRTTDRKISSDYVATSNYSALAQRIARVEEPVTLPPTEPDPPETTETTVPETTETTVPETTETTVPETTIP